MDYRDVTVQFTEVERAEFCRRGRLKGGMGILLRRLMQRTRRDGRLTINRSDLALARRYYEEHGGERGPVSLPPHRLPERDGP